MRRSCARNLTQAGVPREVAKQVTGHVSDSMWERYNIVIVADKISDFTRKDRSSGFSAAPSRSRTDGSQRDAKIRPFPACPRRIGTVSRYNAMLHRSKTTIRQPQDPQCARAWWYLSDSSLHPPRSEEHTSELQSRLHLVCRLLLEKKKTESPTASPPPFPSTPSTLSPPTSSLPTIPTRRTTSRNTRPAAQPQSTRTTVTLFTFTAP